MPQDRKNLEKLLMFIEEVANKEGNEWFKKELAIKFASGLQEFPMANGSSNTTITEDVQSIRKYLLLDVIPVIDYSDVNDGRIRDQLYRDCVEMAKYRLGKINNNINFDEFCRYAHLQAEELLNYFYHSYHSGSIADISLFIKKHTRYDPKIAAESLNHIDYKTKLSAFKNFANLSNATKTTLDFINDLRNEISHRNSYEKENEDSVLSQYSQLGFAANKYTNLSALDIDAKKIFFKGKYLVTKRLQNFNSIYDALHDLKKVVVTQLKIKTTSNEHI